MMSRLFVLAVAAMIWAEPVLAAPGRARRPKNVPEIDLFSGAAALMILATLALLLWERHRRALHH